MSSRAQMMSLETIIALVFTLLVTGVMIGFVVTQTDSRGHFQEFYVKDLSLLAEVVVASPGELIVTYDNLKQGIGLGYGFEDGLINVFLDIEEISILSSQLVRAYGTYNNLLVREESFADPSFMTFIKTGDELIVTESVGYLKGCVQQGERIFAKSFALGEQSSHVDDVFRVNQEQLRIGFQESMRVLEREVNIINLESADSQTTIFTLKFQEHSEDSITVFYGDQPQDEYLACVLARQLEGISIGLVRVQKTEFFIATNVDIVLYGSQPWLDERLIGQIIGRTVALYERQ